MKQVRLNIGQQNNIANGKGSAKKKTTLHHLLLYVHSQVDWRFIQPNSETLCDIQCEIPHIMNVSVQNLPQVTSGKKCLLRL